MRRTLLALGFTMSQLTAIPTAAAAPRDPAQMTFPTPAQRRRFAQLRAELSKRAAGFRHLAPRFLGNFISEGWCGPNATPAACDGGAIVNDQTAGNVFYRLEALHHEQDWPQVFGLVVNLGELPAAKDGLGVRFWLSEDGRRIVGDGLQVTWLGNQNGSYTPRASLGTAVALTVHEVEVRVAAPDGWHAELARLVASPESLKATAEARYAALLGVVHAKIEAGEIKGYDEGRYQNDGIPPVRTPRPLTPVEKRDALDLADREIAARLAFVRANFSAMHARLRAVVPVDILLGVAPATPSER